MPAYEVGRQWLETVKIGGILRCQACDNCTGMASEGIDCLNIGLYAGSAGRVVSGNRQNGWSFFHEEYYNSLGIYFIKP